MRNIPMKILTIAIILINISMATAEDDWQLNIKAKILEAENRFVIGQMHDASDWIDGRYDIPALLSGDIRAYIKFEDDKLWKDIKKSCEDLCQKTWDIFVESPIVGNEVGLTWNLLDIPDNISINLLDRETGKIIDMKTDNEYSFKNTGEREFTVEVYRQ